MKILFFLLTFLFLSFSLMSKEAVDNRPSIFVSVGKPFYSIHSVSNRRGTEWKSFENLLNINFGIYRDGITLKFDYTSLKYNNESINIYSILAGTESKIEFFLNPYLILSTGLTFGTNMFDIPGEVVFGIELLNTDKLKFQSELAAHYGILFGVFIMKADIKIGYKF